MVTTNIRKAVGLACTLPTSISTRINCLMSAASVIPAQNALTNSFGYPNYTLLTSKIIISILYEYLCMHLCKT